MTESAFVSDLGKSLEVLTRFAGCTVLVFHPDDFGTGFSSMQQLALLPFTELKLDKILLVDRCYEDPPRLAIIESSIELARKLGFFGGRGGRREATWQLLAKLGCDQCQGFLLLPVPCPASELMDGIRLAGSFARAFIEFIPGQDARRIPRMAAENIKQSCCC